MNLPEPPAGMRWKIVRSGGNVYPLYVYLQKKGWFFWQTVAKQLAKPGEGSLHTAASTCLNDCKTSLDDYIGVFYGIDDHDK